MRECCTCGSVRGALGNQRPYRDTKLRRPARPHAVASPELHACRCLVWFLGPSGPEGLERF